MKKFPKGARVIFLGSSITVGGWVSYVYDEYLRQMPESGIEMYNCGISGGCAQSATDYLEEYGLCYNPTHAVILLGINDAGLWMYTLPDGANNFENAEQMRYSERCARIGAYCEKMEKLVDILQGRGIAVTLCSPSCFDESHNPSELRTVGFDAALEYMGECNRQLAERKGCEYMNMHALMRQFYPIADIVRPDRVHLHPQGQILMAKLFLAAQGMLPMPDFGDAEAVAAYIEGAKEENNELLQENAKLHTMARSFCRAYDGDYLIACRSESDDPAVRKAYVEEFLKTAQDFWIELAEKYLEIFPNKEKYRKELVAQTKLCASSK